VIGRPRRTFKGDVGILPAGVSIFVPVQRAVVHKRIEEGKPTAFVFTSPESKARSLASGAKSAPDLAKGHNQRLPDGG
jgi:hypothetical protein